jgi:phage shock protein A
MTTLIRWTTGLVARIDSAIAQVENHEALADDAIRRVTHSVGRARAQLARVSRDGKALRERLAAEEPLEGKWKRRAVAEASEERALECLHRARASKRRVADLKRRAEEHEETERVLSQNLRRLEERLREIRERRNTMQSREKHAEATLAIRGADSALDCPIDDIFERWEARLGAVEVLGDESPDDPFEEAFERREMDAELRAELAELRRSS